MRYNVKVTYTPDDCDCDRDRSEAAFETDSTDKFEVARLAVAAWQAAKGPGYDADRFIKMFMEDLKGDLDDQTLEDDHLEFFAFGNNGEWFFDVDAVAAL